MHDGKRHGVQLQSAATYKQVLGRHMCQHPLVPHSTNTAALVVSQCWELSGLRLHHGNINCLVQQDQACAEPMLPLLPVP
jgi:hypothetical protein